MKSLFSFVPFRLVLFLFVSAAVVSAQKPTPTPTPPVSDDLGPTRVFEVRLPVTVTQKKNLVSGLTRGDFAVFEDGVQQEVTFFSIREVESARFCRCFDGHFAINRGKDEVFKRGGEKLYLYGYPIAKGQGGVHDL